MIFLQAELPKDISKATSSYKIEVLQEKKFIIANNKKIAIDKPEKKDEDINSTIKLYDIDEKFKKIKSLKISKKRSFDKFLEFNKKSLNDNVFSFPIRNIKSVQDPKTKALPRIMFPDNVEYSQAIDTIGLQASLLPKTNIDKDGISRITSDITPNSLLWLPKPYLTAGSFHTELYPHDTSAVLWSLSMVDDSEIRNKNLNLMRNQLDNFLFEVENFGYTLNGNRGYQSTRSQTSLITTNVLWQYKLEKDLSWLKNNGLPLAEKSFNYWTHPIAEVMISINDDKLKLYKWIAHGEGPCFEVIDSHKEHNYYYFKVLNNLYKYKKLKNSERPIFAQDFNYDKVITQINKKDAEKILTKLSKVELMKLDDNTIGILLNSELSNYSIPEPIIEKEGKLYRLTPYYYLSDRLNRVSGYDTCHLYGPFNSFTQDFLPCDHNLILYKSAKDLEDIAFLLGDYKKAEKYNLAAKEIKKAILNLFWDKKEKMFFDYVISNKTKRSVYPYASSGYAFLCNLFDIKIQEEKEMLIDLAKYIEKNLEGKEGIIASNIETGLHWDKPYVWPIHQIYIVGGLRKYSNLLSNADKEASLELNKIADRIAIKHLLANYIDWLNSKGQKVGEKVIAKEESLLTGYASGSNYSWNLAGVLYLYNSLSKDGKANLKLILKNASR